MTNSSNSAISNASVSNIGSDEYAPGLQGDYFGVRKIMLSKCGNRCAFCRSRTHRFTRTSDGCAQHCGCTGSAPLAVQANSQGSMGTRLLMVVGLACRGLEPRLSNITVGLHVMQSQHALVIIMNGVKRYRHRNKGREGPTFLADQGFSSHPLMHYPGDAKYSNASRI